HEHVTEVHVIDLIAAPEPLNRLDDIEAHLSSHAGIKRDPIHGTLDRLADSLEPIDASENLIRPAISGRRRIVWMYGQTHTRAFCNRHYPLQKSLIARPKLFGRMLADIGQRRKLAAALVVVCGQQRSTAPWLLVITAHRTQRVPVVLNDRNT